MSLPTLQATYDSRQRAFKGKIRSAPNVLLALDPGETTGASLFVELELAWFGQLNTSDPQKALESFTQVFNRYIISTVVMEDYRVYGNRAEQHIGSALSTPRLIGMLETLCYQRRIPFHKQPAGTTKQFCTDEKLKAWGMWPKGMRHAADSIRHGLYFILFPPKALTSEAIQHGIKSRHSGQHVG